MFLKKVPARLMELISIHDSPYSLYRYKESSTPGDYTGQQIIHAFDLRYDRKSKTTSLQHRQGGYDDMVVEFAANVPIRGNVDRITGWYLDQQGLASHEWGKLKGWVQSETQTELSEKKKHYPLWLQNQDNHIDEPWAIRGYFIGPEERYAPPCITVLCANAAMARFLVDRIHDKLDVLKGWGATLLPGVEVLYLGSSRGSNDGDDLDIPDQDPLNAVDIRIDMGSLGNHFMPTMTNRDLSSWATKKHRCGVQVEIVRGSEVIAKATIGGLITVGDEVYGLTVGHLFSPSSTVGEGERQSLSTETGAIMKAWQQGQSCGMEFDWALVKIPGLQKEVFESWMDVNLVQTISGEFRPVLIALEPPSPYTQVVLATPGSANCLRGVLVGPGAVVNIPGSPNPYVTWVCRMEEPWRIRQGDSGSWLLDARNGMLLGVLVAGCPQLKEAYIIPAHEIVDDIKRHYPGDTDHSDLSVNLPNCHPLSRTSQIDLHWHINEYGSILNSSKNLNSVQDLEQLDTRITKWLEKEETFSYIPSSSYNLRNEISPWKPALSYRDYKSLVRKERLASPNSMRYQTNTEEIFLMSHKTSKSYSGIRSPWETESVASRMKKPIHNLPWEGHAIDHVFPESSLNGEGINKLGTYHNKLARNRHDWPPWDRLTARGALDRLRENLHGLITIQRGRIEISLPETKMLHSPFVSQTLSPGCDIVLFAVKVMESDYKFLAICPSPSVAPATSTRPSLFEADYPKNVSIEVRTPYTAWRLPFMLADKGVPDEENLKLLLSTQLDIDISAFQQRRKLNIPPWQSRFYLKELSQYVDLVIYEGLIEDKSPGSKHCQTGWDMVRVHWPSARKDLSPPFSALIGL